MSQTYPLANALAHPHATIIELKSWGNSNQLQVKCFLIWFTCYSEKQFRQSLETHSPCVKSWWTRRKVGDMPDSPSVSCSNTEIPKQGQQDVSFKTGITSALCTDILPCRYSTALNEFPSCCQVWLFSCWVLLWLLHRFFFWIVLLACFYKLMVQGREKKKEVVLTGRLFVHTLSATQPRQISTRPPA